MGGRLFLNVIWHNNTLFDQNYTTELQSNDHRGNIRNDIDQPNEDPLHGCVRGSNEKTSHTTRTAIQCVCVCV